MRVGKWWTRLVLVLGLGGLMLPGCATPLEKDYGRSVRNNLAQQVLHPQAGQTSAPTVGLDPKAGANEMEKYDKSFKAEEKKSIEVKLTQ